MVKNGGKLPQEVFFSFSLANSDFNQRCFAPLLKLITKLSLLNYRKEIKHFKIRLVFGRIKIFNSSFGPVKITFQQKNTRRIIIGFFCWSRNRIKWTFFLDLTAALYRIYSLILAKDLIRQLFDSNLISSCPTQDLLLFPQNANSFNPLPLVKRDTRQI